MPRAYGTDRMVDYDCNEYHNQLLERFIHWLMFLRIATARMITNLKSAVATQNVDVQRDQYSVKLCLLDKDLNK